MNQDTLKIAAHLNAISYSNKQMDLIEIQKPIIPQFMKYLISHGLRRLVPWVGKICFEPIFALRPFLCDINYVA